MIIYILFATLFLLEIYGEKALHWIISTSCSQFISMYFYMVTYYSARILKKKEKKRFMKNNLLLCNDFKQ